MIIGIPAVRQKIPFSVQVIEDRGIFFIVFQTVFPDQSPQQVLIVFNIPEFFFYRFVFSEKGFPGKLFVVFPAVAGNENTEHSKRNNRDKAYGCDGYINRFLG